MTHPTAGTLPAHHCCKRVKNPPQNRLKNGLLTHGLTHQMTHGFDSSFLAVLSALTHFAGIFLENIFTRFLTLFHTRKITGQKGTNKMAYHVCMACALPSYPITSKSQIL